MTRSQAQESARKVCSPNRALYQLQTTYGGVQRAFGKHLIFGVGYNFYLLKELSLNGTYFF